MYGFLHMSWFNLRLLPIGRRNKLYKSFSIWSLLQPQEMGNVFCRSSHLTNSLFCSTSKRIVSIPSSCLLDDPFIYMIVSVKNRREFWFQKIASIYPLLQIDVPETHALIRHLAHTNQTGSFLSNRGTKLDYLIIFRSPLQTTSKCACTCHNWNNLKLWSTLVLTKLHNRRSEQKETSTMHLWIHSLDSKHGQWIMTRKKVLSTSRKLFSILYSSKPVGRFSVSPKHVLIWYVARM